MKLTEMQNEDAVIIALDFGKAFDRVEISASVGTLKYYNFGDYFIKWTTILYSDFQMCTMNYGHTCEACSRVIRLVVFILSLKS